MVSTIIVVLIIILTGLLFFLYRKSPAKVDLTVASIQDAREAVLAGEHVSENTITPLSMIKTGIVQEIRVAEGAQVRNDDTLAVLDNREEKNIVAQRSTDIDIARINLEKLKTTEVTQAKEKLYQARILEDLAEKQHHRSDTLFLQGSISQSELDEINKEYAIRRSQRVIAEAEIASITSVELQLLDSRLTQARLALIEATISLSRTVLLAPSDGKVLDILRKRGELAAPGTAIMLFQSADTVMAVETQVEKGKAQDISQER